MTAFDVDKTGKGGRFVLVREAGGFFTDFFSGFTNVNFFLFAFLVFVVDEDRLIAAYGCDEDEVDDDFLAVADDVFPWVDDDDFLFCVDDNDDDDDDDFIFCGTDDDDDDDDFIPKENRFLLNVAFFSLGDSCVITIDCLFLFL